MDDSLFSSSPVRDDQPHTPTTPRARTPTSHTPQQPPPESAVPFDAEEAREAALARELAGVRQVNEAIEGILGTLERSRGGMRTVSDTVSNASSLLNTWTRLLSQTEHNQRLLLDPTWRGASQDLLDAEAETLQRQQEAEQRAAEAQRRRDEARRRAEDEDRRRLAGPTTTGRGTRGGLRSRGRPVYTASGTVRRGGTTTSTTSSRYGRGTSTSIPSAGAFGYRGSAAGRGTRGSRGSGRGVP